MGVLRFILSVFLLLSAAGQPAAGTEKSPWGKKPYGILLIGPAGGHSWNATISSLRKELGSQKPLETVSGTYGTRELQHALDRLKATSVQKIVVVPLSLHSKTMEIDQLKYMLGISEHPSKAYIDAWRMNERLIKRAKVKLPITIGGGLDAAPLVGEILTAQAKKLSREPAKESVVLVGFGTEADEANTVHKRLLDTLGGQIRAQGGYQDVRTHLMRPSTKDKPKLDADSERRLRTLIKNLSVKSRVIVLTHMLEQDGQERTLHKKLDYLFYRWGAGSLLPDKRITSWIMAEAEKAALTETMVKYKDDGKQRPAENPMKKRKIAP
ncbi:MAG: hypothetical protein ABIJ96_15920 [Elusimicrobiota bacterium]